MLPAFGTLTAAEIFCGPTALVSLLGLAFAAYRLARVPAAFSPIFAGSSLIVLLWLAALGGFLPLASKSLYILGLLCPLLALGAANSDGAASRLKGAWLEILGFVKQPPIAIFVILSLIFWFALLSKSFSTWDEYSHWARVSRQLIEEHRLPTGPESGVHAIGYPPGSGLFHYFFYTNTTWSPVLDLGHEGIVAAAQCILVLLGLPALLHGCRWTQAALCSAVVLGFGYVIKAYGHPAGILLIDHVLTAFLGSVLAGYLVLKNCGRSPLHLLPLLMVLPVLKDIGFILAGLACAIIAVDLLFATTMRRRSAILICLTFALSILATRTIWTHHVDDSQLNGVQVNAQQLTAAKVIEAFSSSAPEKMVTVRNNFVAALGTAPIGGDLFVIGLLPLAVCFYRRRQGNLERTDLILAAGSAVALAAYTFAHLIFYMFIFGDYEGRILASFERYLDIYLGAIYLTAIAMANCPRRPIVAAVPAVFIGSGIMRIIGLTPLGFYKAAWFCLLPLGALVFLERRRPEAARPIWAVGFLAAVLVAFTPDSEKVLRSLPSLTPYEPVAERVEFAAAWEAVRREVPANRSLFMVWQNSLGLEVYMCGYELWPRVHNTWDFALGPPRFEGDIWTMPLSAEKLREKLARYDFVYLGRTDDVFWNRYAELFDSRDVKSDVLLYQVVKTGGVDIRLLPVGSTVAANLRSDVRR